MAFREIMTRFGFQVDEGKIKAMNVQVAKSKKQLSLAAREARKFRQSMNLVAGAAKAMTIALAGSAIVKKLTTDYSGPLDELAKFSAAMGMNVEDMQGWVHGAGLSGASAKELQTAIQKLSVNMTEAAGGGKEQQEAFRDIGVAYKDAAGQIKPQKQLLMEIADRFAASEDGAVKAALAVKVFGKSGAKLVPFLNAGSKGIAEMSAEARRLGIVMSGKQAAEAEAYNDSMARVKAVFVGIRNQIAARLLPALTDLGMRFQEWATTGNVATQMATALGNALKLAAFWLAKMAATKIAGMMSALESAARAAWSSLMLQLGAIRANVAAMWTLSATGTKAGNVLRFFGLAALKAGKMVTLGFSKWILILTAVGAIVGAVYGMLTGQGGEIGKIAGGEAMAEMKKSAMDLWKVIKPLIPYLAKALVWVINAILKVLAFVVRTIVYVVSKVGPAFRRAGEIAASAWQGLKDVIAWIGEVGSEIGSALGRAWKAAADVAVKAWNVLKSPFVWLYDKLLAMYDLMTKIASKSGWKAFLSGNSFFSALGGVVADSKRVQSAPPPSVSPQDNSVRVQSLSVNVQGAPSMSPAELSRRIKDGVGEGLGDIVKRAYANRAQAVP